MEIQPSTVTRPREMASPSLVSTPGTGDAYEVKFRLTSREAEDAEAWARAHLTPDPHGHNGVYRTTSLYLDTPFLDIYHKTPGYRRSKFRLRRYGVEPHIHLERKSRRGDRVRKRREVIALADVPRLLDEDGGGAWFGPQVRRRLLRPICWIGYTRTAFTSVTPSGPLRLTLDRDAVGTTASAWDVPDRVNGRILLSDEVILELKFRSSLPKLFHELLAVLPSRVAGVSKYSRCVEAWGLARR
jgi:hypothetical protein